MAATDPTDAFQPLNAEQVRIETFSADSPVTLLHRYWRSIAPTPDALPGRQHLDPLDIDPIILPWLFIMDVERVAGAELDYTYRLVGTGNVTLVGRDATGQRASTVFGRTGSGFVMGTFDQTVASAAPTYWVATVPHERFGHVTIHRGLFPLARDGRTVDMLLCVAAPWPSV